LLVEAAVIGGRDRWRRRIEGLASDLRLSALAEEDETQAAVLARTLEDLASFAGYAIPLIDAQRANYISSLSWYSARLNTQLRDGAGNIGLALTS
jgi:hypothetical protein